MNKEELIQLLEKLNFPKEEYYILSSGCLVLYGLRDKAGDLDLCISEELFKQIKEKYNLTEDKKNNCGFYPLEGENVEVVVNSKETFDIEEKDGYNVQNLYKLLKDKKARNLPKDQKDIINIENYIKQNNIEYRDLYDGDKKHYAYMVRCADNTIYSGYAVNPYKRAEVHNSGKGAKYTRNRLPVKLVYYEEFDNKIDAMKREYALKQLTHKEKEELIKVWHSK